MTTYKSEQIEFRAGRIVLTEAQWTANTNVYAEGIVAITSDGSNAGKTKVFDGSHYWSQLSYTDSGGGSVTSDNVTVTGTMAPGPLTTSLDTLKQNVSDQATSINNLAQQIPSFYDAVVDGTSPRFPANTNYDDTFTILNPNVGEFRITADIGSPFIEEKTFVSAGVLGTTPFTWSAEVSDETSVKILFFDITGTQADPTSWSIRIHTNP